MGESISAEPDMARSAAAGSNRPRQIDRLVLESVLSFAEKDHRAALLAQIIADLRRLGRGLAAQDAGNRNAMAHELKGLCATIGATRLAELAEAVEHPGQTEAALQDLCRTICGQIPDLCAELAREATPTGTR